MVKQNFNYNLKYIFNQIKGNLIVMHDRNKSKEVQEQIQVGYFVTKVCKFFVWRRAALNRDDKTTSF